MTSAAIAASAASYIACAGDEVVMGENAEIMIHEDPAGIDERVTFPARPVVR